MFAKPPHLSTQRAYSQSRSRHYESRRPKRRQSADDSAFVAPIIETVTTWGGICKHEDLTDFSQVSQRSVTGFSQSHSTVFSQASHRLLTGFSEVSHRFLTDFSQVSHRVFTGFSEVSHRFLRCLSQVSHRLLTGFSQTSHRFPRSLSQVSHRLLTGFSEVSHRSLTDFSRVSHRLLTGFPEASHRFLTDFSQVSQRCLTGFSEVSHRFLTVFSQVSHRILTGFSEVCHRSVNVYLSCAATWLPRATRGRACTPVHDVLGPLRKSRVFSINDLRKLLAFDVPQVQELLVEVRIARPIREPVSVARQGPRNGLLSIRRAYRIEPPAVEA